MIDIEITMPKVIEVGARVRAIAEVDDNVYVLGKAGTVIADDYGIFGVEFDERVGGHDLLGKCVEGYGWWCRPEKLEVIR